MSLIVRIHHEVLGKNDMSFFFRTIEWSLSIIFIALSLFITGCSSKPSSFYLLTPSFAGRIHHDKRTLSIGIGPINIAKYIDMPQIVTRDGNQQVYIHEYHRWSSPLLDNIQNVLNEDLNGLIPRAHIFI